MLHKLQRKTLPKGQLLGYAFALMVAVVLLGGIWQLYRDVKPLLEEQTDIFSSNYAVVTKPISAIGSLQKEMIYFTPAEQESLRQEPFVKSMAPFSVATFKIMAYTRESEGEFPLFATDLFFESIPDKYIDVKSDQWEWNPSRSFVPIIIPENYLSLYNFGFAQSQGLPVLSKGLIDKFTFGLRLSGNGKEATFSSRIVGFSAKINSILVPEDFLSWANATYGSPTSQVSRLLVEFHDPSQKEILAYFKAHNYTIAKDDLELSKMRFFFSSALWVVVGIALLILILSVGVVVLSLHLVLQRNKEQIHSLLSIGYTPAQIARYYQWAVSLFTIGAIIAALSLCYGLRNLYMAKLSQLFPFTPTGFTLPSAAFALSIVLCVLYSVILVRGVRGVKREV